jgi:hypothetical protein
VRLPLSLLEVALCFVPDFIRGRTLSRRGQFNARPPRLRKTDSNRLLRGPSTVFARADVFDFFAHKFAGLRRWGFAFALCATGTLDSFFQRHDD